MSKNKKNAKTSKKGNLLPILAAAIVVVCLAVVFVINSGGLTGSKTKAVTVAPGESLEIPTATVTEEASFYPVEVDGTQMEVLAVKASDGTIRTAFNTCQSCYTSGKGYYKVENQELVCNNCGFHFSPDEVEVSAGGCNPWPIFEEDKTVTGDTISISYDFLAESKSIFADWRK